ncbi:MAG: peptide chain release factor H [bacterium]|nr:peptide chain release factor H [bacterium]
MNNNCWLQVSAGSGPEECRRTVGKVYETICAEAAEKNIKTSLVHAVPSGIKGNYKSLLLSLQGNGLENFRRSWQGTVQWIWKSKYRPNHKRKNWFVSVDVFTPREKSGGLSEKDIKIETIRAGGPGGQHVNKTESAVRITHLPSGITVRADEERSQHMNKKLAIARLDMLLEEQQREQQKEDEKERWKTHNQLERGNGIRIYKGESFKRVDDDGDGNGDTQGDKHGDKKGDGKSGEKGGKERVEKGGEK